jgi:multidrug efflux pump subunit AcrB
MLLLTGAMVAIFVFVFSRFISTYTQIKINRVPDIAARQYEIMSMGYFVLVVVFVINGVNALCHALFENSDLSILISMPFSSSEIFLSKLTAVYLKQAVLALVCVPTLNFTFLCTTDTLNVYNGIMTFAVALLLPIIPLGIASIVVLESIYRRHERGDISKGEAALEGTRRVWTALVASTLTTVAIFLPVLQLNDVEGQLFADLALTIACAVTVSMVVAVTVLPAVAARWMGHERLIDPFERLWCRVTRHVIRWTATAPRRWAIIVLMMTGPVLVSWLMLPKM